jgi:hypothetical protein
MIARAQALNNQLGTTFDASLIERGKRKHCFEGYPDCCSGSPSEIELNEPNQSLLSCPNILKQADAAMVVLRIGTSSMISLDVEKSRGRKRCPSSTPASNHSVKRRPEKYGSAIVEREYTGSSEKRTVDSNWRRGFHRPFSIK